MIYVYRLPAKLSDGYCFGAGKPIAFTNVDWFEGGGFPGAEVGPTKDELTAFVRNKRYYDPRARFLVLGEKPEHVFTIEPVTPSAVEPT